MKKVLVNIGERANATGSARFLGRDKHPSPHCNRHRTYLSGRHIEAILKTVCK
ncbi:MAG: hypothetical protein KAI83_02190 [Thiomargarita sp.]|nr:hypothetical protein [Thiomargarita sp.]